MTPALIAPARAKFDLTLYLEPDGDSLNATWLFDRDLFESSTIERASARFLALVGELANRPNEPLRSGPWHRVCPFTREGRAAGSTAEPTDLMTLVERRVRQDPQRVALACGCRAVDMGRAQPPRQPARLAPARGRRRARCHRGCLP